MASKCSSCSQVPKGMFVGTWHIILWSRNLLLTTIADLDAIIDKIEARQPIKMDKTFYEWVKDPPEILCPQLTGKAKLWGKWPLF